MSKEKKQKVGCTEFVKEQYEEGVEQKLKGASPLSIWYVHKAKQKC
jgi:hypothetical protein